MDRNWDVVVVGSGPNGLTAAVTLARAGYEVLVLEGASSVGGGTRTVECTLPGFLHDECSAVHPTALLSPAWRELPLADHGLHWCRFAASAAHPLEDRPAPLLLRSPEATGQTLEWDAESWVQLMAPFLDRGCDLMDALLGPLPIRSRDPLLLARFGLQALPSARWLASRHFAGEPARALFAGCAAHSVLTLEHLGTAAFGLIFGLSAHLVDWPCARGGSRAIGAALAGVLRAEGGSIRIDCPVRSLRDLPPSRVVLLDLSPAGVVGIAADDLPTGYVRRLRAFRYGPGVFKLDWALDGPIPWRDPAVGGASTVHVGGTMNEIAASERDAWEGRVSDRPFLILCQQSVADPTRAPAGQHTGYAYCHVPAACNVDMTARIEAQVERFAPGFRELVLARHATRPADFERSNPNLVGGAITGGACDLRQLFTRPVPRWDPYATPNPRIFLCSASTPPGGGVHGMCGWHAAQSAMRALARGV